MKRQMFTIPETYILDLADFSYFFMKIKEERLLEVSSPLLVSSELGLLKCKMEVIQKVGKVTAGNYHFIREEFEGLSASIIANL
jgi:hypothetical protein